MRRTFSEIENSNLFTTDGLIGQVTDLLVEEESWNIRYLVVNLATNLFPLGGSLKSRSVLIAPAAIAGYETATNTIATILTSQQVIDSPRLDSDRPISREYEQALVGYFGWPIYWFGRTVQMKPQTLGRLANGEVSDAVSEESASNLRSAAEICGYEIQSQDGPAGIMRDLVINLSSWTIDFATAEPESWMWNERLNFSTKWISQVDWESQQIAVDLSKAVLEPANPLDDQPAITGEPHSARPLRIT